MAMLAQVLADPSSTIPCLGASGAIAAVMGAFIVTYPRDRIRALIFFLIFFRVTYIPAVILIGFWFLIGVQLRRRGRCAQRRSRLHRPHRRIHLRRRHCARLRGPAPGRVYRRYLPVVGRRISILHPPTCDRKVSLYLRQSEQVQSCLTENQLLNEEEARAMNSRPDRVFVRRLDVGMLKEILSRVERSAGAAGAISGW